MPTLHIDNSVCRITGLTETHLKALREVLSYQVDPQAAYFSGNTRGTKRYLIDKKGNFSSGLLYLVKGYLKAQALSHDVKDVRIRPVVTGRYLTLSLKTTPYSDQVQAVDACKGVTGGIVSMVTGSGKSLTMALLVNQLQVRTLIVVPNLELKKQLQKSFDDWFGATPHIRIENIDSTALDKLTCFDLLIIDECHHSAAKTYRRLNRTAWKGIYYRFCFTATPYRSRDEEQLLMESVTGLVIYQLDYKTAVERGYIVPIEAYYIELEKRKVQGHSWAQVYSELVTNHKDRNKKIAEILATFSTEKKSALCLVKEIQHGKNIQFAINGPYLCDLVDFIKGENDDNREKILEFNLRDIPVLIGTTGVLGEGVDTRPCEYVIIAGLGKSKPAFMQQCGRAVRRYPGKTSAKVIIFLDKSHKFTLRHFKAQCKILKEEYGCVPVKLEVA